MGKESISRLMWPSVPVYAVETFDVSTGLELPGKIAPVSGLEAVAGFILPVSALQASVQLVTPSGLIITLPQERSLT
jgi:hypothetical protein